MEKSLESKITKRLKKAALINGVFYFFLFLGLGFFKKETSFLPVLVGAFVGSFFGAFVFYFFYKKILFYMTKKVEEGFKNVEVAGTKFETYAEIGPSIFNRKAGKLFVTDEKLVFKPSVYNKSIKQPFNELCLSDVNSVRTEKNLLGRVQVVLSTKEEQYVINPFDETEEFVNRLTPS